jgi:transposase-like protein
MKGYSSTVKREAVTLYIENGDYQLTIGELERRYGVTVSVRSIQYWMKRPENRSSRDEHGDLVLFQTNVINPPPPKQVIDKDKFLAVYGKLFEQSDKRFSAIQRRILEEFGTDRIEKALKEMPPLELMRLYRMISNEKQKAYEFVLNAVGRTDDEGVETLGQLFEQVEKAIEGGENIKGEGNE